MSHEDLILLLYFGGGYVGETFGITMGSKSFEDLKKVNEYGAEYWSAQEIQLLLGYTQWRRFEDAVKRAITSCKQSGNEYLHHFAGVGKMIDIGKGV